MYWREETLYTFNHWIASNPTFPLWDNLSCLQRMSNTYHWIYREQQAKTLTTRDDDFLRPSCHRYLEAFPEECARVKNVSLAIATARQMPIYTISLYKHFNFISTLSLQGNLKSLLTIDQRSSN
jgi:hypothetical protein